MEPTASINSDMPDEQRMQRHLDWLAQYRALVDEHTRLVPQHRDLHERYLAVEGDPAVSADERPAQTVEIVRAEDEALKQSQPVVEAIHQFLNAPQ